MQSYLIKVYEMPDSFSDSETKVLIFEKLFDGYVEDIIIGFVNSTFSKGEFIVNIVEVAEINKTKSGFLEEFTAEIIKKARSKYVKIILIKQ